MTIIVPNCGEVAIAQKTLNQVLSLRLYSNNIVPDETTTIDSLIEVVGGGYAAKSLTYENWAISNNAICIYPAQDFYFTAAPNAPGTTYGYYLVDPNGTLVWVERFPTSILPFTPLNGTLIRATPRVQFT